MAKESPLGFEPEPAPIARERVWTGGPIKDLRRKLARVDPRELDTWLWSFTEPLIRQLVAEVIPDPEVAVFGDLPTATASLHGYAVEDLDPELLEERSRDYPIVITLFARKPLQNP